MYVSTELTLFVYARKQSETSYCHKRLLTEDQ